MRAAAVHGTAALRAPAKLTRTLSIVGTRPDGYHLLEAEMVTVSLEDEVEISAGSGFEVVDEIGWTGRGAPPPLGPAGVGSNLVERALGSIGRSAHVRLRKRIPAGAGLGGGSADAAAVLRWARCVDLGVALALGADVPFCVRGGRAMVRGIGETVEPLDYERSDILLIVPPLAVSTPAVYGAWDSLGGPAGELGNDLEAAALKVEPRLAWWRNLVAQVSGVTPRLAGSGGTWWLEGTEAEMSGLVAPMSAAILATGESALVRHVVTVPSS
ncbi:MAG: 4-(cytidine 5'-diphospho)-2-C-methyl-D-erythritol kinase [Acidimicrobiales bacterium]